MMNKSVACDDDSQFSLVMFHLKSWLRFTFENIASKPGGQIVLRTADSCLLVAERVSFWIQDSSSLGYVPWLVMLPFLIYARVANFCLSLMERITGLPMPTQSRIYNTIRTLRNGIRDIKKMEMKKMGTDEKKVMESEPISTNKIQAQVGINTSSDEEAGACAIIKDIYSQDSEPISTNKMQAQVGKNISSDEEEGACAIMEDIYSQDSEPISTNKMQAQVGENISSDEEEGACAIMEDIYSQIIGHPYQRSSTLEEESSECDSELGQKIESMLSTHSTTQDESYFSC